MEGWKGRMKRWGDRKGAERESDHAVCAKMQNSDYSIYHTLLVMPIRWVCVVVHTVPPLTLVWSTRSVHGYFLKSVFSLCPFQKTIPSVNALCLIILQMKMQKYKKGCQEHEKKNRWQTVIHQSPILFLQMNKSHTFLVASQGLKQVNMNISCFRAIAVLPCFYFSWENSLILTQNSCQ